MPVKIDGKVEYSKSEQECLNFLRSPTLLGDVKEELDYTIIGEEQNKLSMFLLCLSKDFDPQAIYLMGSSSAGKSYLINQVLGFFPDDCIEKFTRSSTHGLEYLLKDKDMNGKILVIQEALGGEQAEGSLRPMISKDQQGLRIVTVDFNRQAKVLNIKGCPVYITSTADVDVEHQMTTRVWFLSPDESEEQTREILKYQAKKVSSLVDIESKKKELIKNAIKLLKPYKIIVCYAEKLQDKFPTNKVKYRRDFEKLLTLVKCSAHLYQYQRKTENGILYASITDLVNALGVARNILKQTLMGLPDISIRILNTIKEMESDDIFKGNITHQTIAGKMDLAEGTIRRYIQPLWVEGYVTRDESIRPYKYSITTVNNPITSLLTVTNNFGDFFSEKEFNRWLSDHCYSVTKCSVCYQDINPFAHTSNSNTVTLAKEGVKSEIQTR